MVALGLMVAFVAPDLEAKKTTRERFVPTAAVRGGAARRGDLPLAHPGFHSAAVSDTLILAQYDFEGVGGADAQGWVGVDRTSQPDTFFHVDDFVASGSGSFGGLTPLEGSRSLWCGVAASPTDPEACNYATAPGYGNGWDQRFESIAFPVQGNVTLSYKVRWDSEPGYDATHVEYLDGAGEWTEIASYGGWGGLGLDESFVIDSALMGSDVRFRFRFDSDGAWSDEDGWWETDGAVIVDSITVADATGVVDYQDFELEPVGALTTADGDWSARPVETFGRFEALYPGLSVLQEDPCALDASSIWGFFADPAVWNYACGGHPEQGAIPYKNTDSYYMWNEIWSPPIPLAGSGSEVLLTFDVYRNLPLDALIFYVWHVRSWVSGCPRRWADRNFVYYGWNEDWLTVTQPVGDLIDPAAESVQVALGVIDMCGYWCGLLGTGACHTQGPLFDNVTLERVHTTGPVWYVSDFHMFQDNFATDGTTTGTVRADMAFDIGEFDPESIPGDSVVVTVFEGSGLGGDPYTGSGSAVYAHVAVFPQNQPGKSGASLQADGDGGPNIRWPLVDSTIAPDGTVWYQFRMDEVGESYSIFCFDLNDSLLTPGDTVLFYFSATDAGANTTYFSLSTGTTASQAEVEAAPMEMTCLPANALNGATDILYVDDYDQLGAQSYFEDAFEALGITPDRFDVRGPWSSASNGPASRVKSVYNQLVGPYRTIIWNSGDVRRGTIGDGSYPLKEDDYEMLMDFLRVHPNAGGVGLYISGDNVASEWSTSQSASASALRSSYMNFILANYDHRAAGLPVSPYVVGQAGSIFDHSGARDELIAEGGCPTTISTFDVLQATGSSTVEAAYQDNPAAAAVLRQETTNEVGNPARVVLSGFSLHKARDGNTGLPSHIEHLQDILAWFQGSGTVPPTCQVDPNSIDFDSVVVGAYVDTTFIITNVGADVLNGNVSSPCSHYKIIAGGTYNLGPGEEDTVTVRFEPTSLGLHNCTIETGYLLCSDVYCAGTGILPPTACDIQPAALDFGVVNVGAMKESTFVITNTGEGSLSGSVSEPCPDYSIVSGGTYYLGAGEADTVTVRFAPTSVGTLLCTIETGDYTCSDVAVTGVGLSCYSVLKVDSSAAGSGDGSSWADAYTGLRDALATASLCPTTTEIWVARGTYTPTAGTDRTASFHLRNDLAVYGGFNGTEVSRGERDWKTNVTILSGDIGVVANSTDNSHHVVTATGTDSTAILDGFTITAGRADSAPDDNGAGVFATNSSATLANLVFAANDADQFGGGLYILGGQPVLSGVVFEDNSASDGGGAFLGSGTRAIIANAVFRGNNAAVRGGGLRLHYADMELVNGTFHANVAATGGGISMAFSDFPEIVNTVLWGDNATSDAEISNFNTVTNIVSSLIQGCGSSGAGWNPACGTDGGGNLDADPLFIAAPGNLRLGPGSPAMDTGDDAAPNLPATDLDGNPRIAGSAVDMGAYEDPWGAVPRGVVAPSNFNFGRVGVGSVHDTTFTITNVGSGTLSGDVTVGSPFYSVTSGGGPFSLAHGETLTVDIRYAPANPGIHKSLIETGSVHCDRLALIADLAEGLQVARVSDPSIPTLLGSYDTPGYANDVVASGNYAYVADRMAGLQIIDISDPTNPKFAGAETADYAGCVAVSGDYAYVAAAFSGLRIIDISDPGNPTFVGSYDTPEEASQVAVSGSYAFVADLTSGLQIIDISDPVNPTLAGSLSTPDESRDVVVSGTYAYEAAASRGLRVIDISDPGTPLLAGTCDTPGTGASFVFVKCQYAYVTDPSSGVHVIDVSDPANPSLVASYNTPGTPLGVFVDGDFAYVGDGNSGLQILDVFEPSNPDSVGALDGPGYTQSVFVVPGGDVACAGFAGYEYARIDSVVDVPNDQGGQVRIHLTRSMYDFAEETELPIAGYQVWRRVDGLAAIPAPGSASVVGGEVTGGAGQPSTVSTVPEEGLPNPTGLPLVEMDGRYFLESPSGTVAGVLPPGTWEYIYWVFAVQQENYIIVSSTLADSSQAGIPYSVYVVTTHTTTPSIWFTSPVDSGYSVDNIAPGVPQGLAVAYGMGSGNQLSWDPSPEPDFQYYRVFRGTAEDFTPDSTTVVYETATPGWTDPTYNGGGVFYMVTAVDHAGNESPPASPTITTAVTEAAIPTEFALHQNVPNPFNPTTAIRYDVPTIGGRVTLRVYDVAGRLVRTLVDETATPGEKRAVWDGRDDHGSAVVTGVYFYRMTAPSYSSTRKMVLLK